MDQPPIMLSNGSDSESWYVINDGVMGGVSESKIVQLEDAVRFEGTVRLENNGGFASMRKEIEPIKTLLPEAIVQLEVRGDGQEYECRFRMDGSRLSYVHAFTTKADEITSISLLIKDFKPSFRGRKYDVDEVGYLDLERLQELGILIAGKQKGPFQIEVLKISL
ncbi:MAG: CIA30 family protein [Saprospiraceae bacterium]